MESGEVPKDICYTGYILWICCWNRILLRYASIINSVTLLVYDGLWILADIGQKPGTLVFTWCSTRCPWLVNSQSPMVPSWSIPKSLYSGCLSPFFDGQNNIEYPHEMAGETINHRMITSTYSPRKKMVPSRNIWQWSHQRLAPKYHPYIHKNDIINLHQPGHHRPSDFGLAQRTHIKIKQIPYRFSK